MRSSMTGEAVREIQAVLHAGSMGSWTDGELLERFVAGGDGVVFEAIIRRHGPMVWNVCRRVLRDHHDAEDAFQATFLVLARKASSLLIREKLGHWLYGVAHQTARKARAAVIKRAARQTSMAQPPEPEVATAKSSGDLLARLDRELSRLPTHYQIPIVLCELEGMSHREAAEHLGWPIGTVSGRLSRGRTLLARRLTRNGTPVAEGALAAALARNPALAGVPPTLIRITTKAAGLLVAGSAATELVSVPVATLVKGTLNMMLVKKIGAVAVILTTLVALSAAGSLRPIHALQGVEAPGAVVGPLVNRGEDAATPAESPDEETARKEGLALQEKERKLIEGTWAITRFAPAGQETEETKKASSPGRVDIKGDKIRVKLYGDSNRSWSFSIDPSKSPKRIALIPLNEDDLDEDLTTPIELGSYKIEDDTLTICHGVDYPDKFEATPDSPRTLAVLKRAKW